MAALAYPLLTALGLVLSAFLWENVLDRKRTHAQPGWDAIFIAALAGLAIGAKLGYALAEGLWIADAPLGSAEHLLQVFSGKTVTGGLLGAYLGVELAKRRIGYTQPTGDTFAVVAPLSLMIGRAGCLIGGCCTGIPLERSWLTLPDAHGVHRWPAVPVELAFNALFLAFAATWTLRRKRGATASALDGQLFHLYLIAYGLFRFAHELVRDTPRVLLGYSGYQVLSLALVVLGAARFWQRREASRLAAFALVALLAAACSSGDDAAPQDGGPDSGLTDSGSVHPDASNGMDAAMAERAAVDGGSAACEQSTHASSKHPHALRVDGRAPDDRALDDALLRTRAR